MENEEKLLSLFSIVEELFNIRKLNNIIPLLIIYGKHHLINSTDATYMTNFHINFWFVWINTQLFTGVSSFSFYLSLSLSH